MTLLEIVFWLVIGILGIGIVFWFWPQPPADDDDYPINGM